MRKILAQRDEGNEQSVQDINALEKELKDRDDTIKKLNNQLKDKESDAKLSDAANDGLQKKLDEVEAKLARMTEAQAKLESDMKAVVEGLVSGHKRELEKSEKRLLETEKRLTETTSELMDVQNREKGLTEELNKIKKGSGGNLPNQ